MGMLEDKVTGKKFAVVTAHLKAGDKADFRAGKIQHGGLMADMINDLIKTLKVPVIYAGDLNTSPTTPAFKAFRGKCPSMQSAYQTVLGAEQEFTTYKWRKGGDQPKKIGINKQTIDFIHYSEAHWKVHRVMGHPTAEEVEKTSEGILLPNWRYPSDHFALAADLELKVTA